MHFGCAYANYGGGDIIFGVTDAGETNGIPDPEAACLSLETKINDSICPVPEYFLEIREDHSICLTLEGCSILEQFHRSIQMFRVENDPCYLCARMRAALKPFLACAKLKSVHHQHPRAWRKPDPSGEEKDIMGIYLNPGNSGFQESLNSEIYVDKTDLISYTNSVLHTRQKYICVSRPRRFGKSMAMDMLAAYYGRGIDSHAQFQALSISRDGSYRKHLNQYDVLKINMQEFLSRADTPDAMLRLLERRIQMDLKKAYSDEVEEDFLFSMKNIFAATGRPFIILIDEWDCLFREYPKNAAAQKKYLDFLRAWLKDQEFIALAYMTGILPIKKYGTHSALNMFSEYSMTDSGNLAPFFGFTEEEVNTLCEKYGMTFEEAKSWYDGYFLFAEESTDPTAGKPSAVSIYNPKSVVEAMLHRRFSNYWNRTESYEALKIYIQMNMDGLKDAVISMLGGARIPIHTETFSNDMTTFSSRDDVLTLLVHLGYLTYHAAEGTVSIPNKEVSQEYVNAIRTMDWSEVSRSIEDSRRLLEALWNLDSDTVAAGIGRAHEEIPALEYHDENSLSCTIQLAFYFAREYYTIIREFPSGKGFADIVLLPRKLHADKPAAVIELKWDRSAEGAIAQIRERNYAGSLREYHGNLILAGINYDRKSKKHSCKIEKWDMQKFSS